MRRDLSESVARVMTQNKSVVFVSGDSRQQRWAFYHPNCGFFMGINGTSQLFWLLAGFIWLRIVWNRSTWDDDEWPAYVSESSVTQSSSAFQECLTAFTIQIHSNVKLAQTISPWFLCWETLFSQLGGPSGMMVRFWSNHMLFCCKKC